MRAVSVALNVRGSVHEAETCWYDTGTWPAWVDGFERVLEITGNWPRAGAVVVWQSGPAGRGRVTEQVVSYQPLTGQTLDVQDDSIRGRQRVSFTPVGAGEVRVELSLEYEIVRRSIATPLIDRLFIRRAMSTSLRGSLGRFGAELASRAGSRS